MQYYQTVHHINIAKVKSATPKKKKKSLNKKKNKGKKKTYRGKKKLKQSSNTCGNI